MEIGEVRAGAVFAIQNTATAEAGHLGGLGYRFKTTFKGKKHLKPSHSWVAVEESCLSKVVGGGLIYDVQHYSGEDGDCRDHNQTSNVEDKSSKRDDRKERGQD